VSGLATTFGGRRLLPAVAGLTGGPVFVALAAQLSPAIAAAGMLAGLAAGAVIVWPYLGFLLTAAMVPLERIGRLTDDSSTYGFSLMRAVGLLTLAGVLLRQMLLRQPVRLSRPFLLYASYIGVGLLTLTYTTDWAYGVRAAGAALGNLMFLFVVINIVKSPAHARAAIACWLAATTAIGIFTIYQWHNPAAVISEDRFQSTGERVGDERFSTVLSDKSEYQNLDETPRALGSTSHPAVYGINVILTLPFFSYLLRSVRGGWMKGAVAACGAVACYNIVLTNTRAAIITLCFTLLLIVLTGLVRFSTRLLVAGVAAAALCLPLTPASLYNRIFSATSYTVGGSDTLRARFAYWSEAVNIAMDGKNWAFGIGLGNQSELPRRLSERMYMPPNSTVHNEYLQSLIETGLVGYGILIAFMVSLYRRCVSGERRFRASGDGVTADLMLASRVALLSVLFYGTQVDVLHFPLKGWWLAMGLAVVLSDSVSRPSTLQVRPAAGAA
jgi:hypothetical protein